MDEKIVKIGVSESQRRKNRFGKLGVPCLVSSRWLKFNGESSLIGAGEAIAVDVMTGDPREDARRICTLYVTREDLAAALKRVRPDPRK
jgi:hypothetical protein